MPFIEAFARVSNHTFYIYDYLQCNIIYVSEHQILPLKISRTDFIRQGYKYLFSHIPPDEHKMLIKIAKASDDIIDSGQIKNKLNCRITFKTHFTCNGSTWLIDITKTPVLLNEKGQMWLALFRVSIATSGKPGELFCYTDEGFMLSYDYKTEIWTVINIPHITKSESEVLKLSAQGYSRSNIAKLTGRSEQTIKSHIHNICKKLSRHTIDEACNAALELGILQ